MRSLVIQCSDPVLNKHRTTGVQLLDDLDYANVSDELYEQVIVPTIEISEAIHSMSSEDVIARATKLLSELINQETIPVEQKIKLLNQLATIFEQTEATYAKDSGSPPSIASANRDQHTIGGLLKAMGKQSHFFDFILDTLESDNGASSNRLLNTSYTRLMVALSPGEDPSLAFHCLQDDDRFEQNKQWILSSRDVNMYPLRVYATGLLGLALPDRNLADTLVKDETVASTLLKRLNGMVFDGSMKSGISKAYRHIQAHGNKEVQGYCENLMRKQHLHSSEVCPAQSGKRKFNQHKYPERLATLSTFFTELRSRELVFLLNSLAQLGEYQEILAPSLSNDLMRTIFALLFMQESPSIYSSPKIVIYSTVRLISHFLAHKKFALEFVDSGGVERLLELAKESDNASYYQSAIVMCFFSFASLTNVMERILTLPKPHCAYQITDDMIQILLEYIASPDPSTRKNAVGVFSLALNYKIVVDIIDQNPRNGMVYRLFNIIQAVSTQPTARTPKTLTRVDRQIGHHASFCLRQYFRTHLALLWNNCQPLSKQRTSYRSLEIDDIATKKTINYISQSKTFPITSAWTPLQSFVHHQGVRILLMVVDQLHHSTSPSNEIRASVLEMAQFSLETLEMVTLIEDLRRPVCSTAFENGRTGLAVLLDCLLNPHLQSDSGIARSALRVLCNCIPVKENAMKTHLCDDTYKLARRENALRVALHALKSNYSSSSHVITTASASSSASSAADELRYLTCRLLTGLAQDIDILHMLDKMGIDHILMEMIQLTSTCPTAGSLEEKQVFQSQFRDCAFALIRRIARTRDQQPSTAANASFISESCSSWNEATDSTIREIEKREIVSRTKIGYDDNEMFQLIHQHLQAKGLSKTANLLLAEANLKVCCSPESKQSFKRPVRLQLNGTISSRKRQQMRKKIGAPHLFESKKKFCQPKAPKPSDSEASGGPISQLDEIMKHYLREQHRQCQNPIEVIPPFSLASIQHQCEKKKSENTTSPSKAKASPRKKDPSANLTKRLLHRELFHSTVGSSSHCSYPQTKQHHELATRRLIHTRYRPWRTYRESGFGILSCCFVQPNDYDNYLMMGTDDGELHLYNAWSSELISTFTVHPQAEDQEDMEIKILPIEAISYHKGQILSSTAAPSRTSPGIATTVLSRLDPVAKTLTPSFTFANAYNGQFNNLGDACVVQTYQQAQENDPTWMPCAAVYDLETGSELGRYFDSKRASACHQYHYTNAIFHPVDDRMLLTDGILWDLRLRRPVHTFDKLSPNSSFGLGFIHPKGNEAIINDTIWDLRNFRLRQLIPNLNACEIRFNPTGDVFYAYPHRQVHFQAPETILPSQRTLRVYDSSSEIRELATIDIDQLVFDISIDKNDNYISLVEGDIDTSSPQVAWTDVPTDCRLYEIGRRKPYDGDSDLDDACDDEIEDDWDEEEDVDGDDEDEDEEEDEEVLADQVNDDEAAEALLLEEAGLL